MIARTAFTQLRHSGFLLILTVAALSVVWIAPPWAAFFGKGLSRVCGLGGLRSRRAELPAYLDTLPAQQAMGVRHCHSLPCSTCPRHSARPWTSGAVKARIGRTAPTRTSLSVLPAYISSLLLVPPSAPSLSPKNREHSDHGESNRFGTEDSAWQSSCNQVLHLFNELAGPIVHEIGMIRSKIFVVQCAATESEEPDSAAGERV